MKWRLGASLLLFLLSFSFSVRGQESTDTYPGQQQIEDSLQSLNNIEGFTQVLEQKQNDTETRVTNIENKASEISDSLKKLQETSEQALLNKDLLLRESEAKSKKLEQTLSFFKGFSAATGISSVVLTLLLIVVVL